MTVIYFVIDHKKKLLVMKFRQSETECFEKTGRSFLGLMKLYWKNEHETFTYGVGLSIWNFAMGENLAQDFVLVSALFKAIVTYCDIQFSAIF